MPLTPQDVQNKRFTVVRLKPGYDEDEVDNFLDEIEEELRRLIAENTSLRQAAAAAASAPMQAPVAAPAPAPAPPPPPPAPAPPTATDESDAALKTLVLAQRTADEAIAQANAEAEGILHSARLKATALEHEAQAAHANRLASLEDERKELEAEIVALRGFEKEFRTRLRAYLESSLSDLDARPTVEPAKAAPRPPAGGGAPSAFGAGPAPVPAAPAAPSAPPHAAPAQQAPPVLSAPHGASAPAAPAPGARPVAPPPAPQGPPTPPPPASSPPAPTAATPPPLAPPATPDAAPSDPHPVGAPMPPEETRSALAAALAEVAAAADEQPTRGAESDAPTAELPRAAGQGVPGVAPASAPGVAPPGFVSQPVTPGENAPSGPPTQAG